MSQIITATYEDGVFKPSEPLDLTPHSTVQLTVEELPNPAEARPSKEEILAMMQKLFAQSKDFSSAPHMTRDELHERR